MRNNVVSTGTPAAPASSASLIQRREWRQINALTFWAGIFPESMAQFNSTQESYSRSKSMYDIRDKTDWHSVYETLELARKNRDSDGGSLRKAHRRKIDRVKPGANAAKLESKVTSQESLATPVLDAVEVILDAVKSTNGVRNQVLADFDGLIPVFADVELFISTFPSDANIRNASIDLTVATLVAIDRAICVFISNESARTGTYYLVSKHGDTLPHTDSVRFLVGKALLDGGDYQKGLIESLDSIQTKSRNLMQQALKSHMFESHMYSQETLKLRAQVDTKLDTLTHGAVQLDPKVDMVVHGYNSIEQLLNDHLQEKDRQIEAARQENVHLQIENVMLRSTSPIRPSTWLPPPQRTHRPILQRYIGQENLRDTINALDIHLVDAAFVQDKKEQLPSKDRARAEQIINTPLFRQWIVSTASAKLLVHWDTQLPRVVAEVSPLSIFCMTLAHSLHPKDRLISALWFCGRHIDVDEHNLPTGGRGMVSSLIDQLLGRRRFNTEMLDKEVGLDSLDQGNIYALIRLLITLVRQLPPDITLFFFVDGAVLFERDEFEDALPVFSTLIQLVDDASMQATVKLLITSTPGTDIIRGPFEQEHLILNVESLPVLAGASEERMARELGGGLKDDEP